MAGRDRCGACGRGPNGSATLAYRSGEELPHRLDGRCPGRESVRPRRARRGPGRGDERGGDRRHDRSLCQGRSRARRLGFDTIEPHGAHGYLIDQFFWAGTNRRQDRYGGATIGERARFAAEIIAAVRAAVGPDFPIIIRLSQWKQQDFSARLAETPDEMAQWLQPLVDAGADAFHCSQRRFWEAEFPQIDGEEGLNFAGWANKLTGAATISVGSVGLSGDFMGAFGGENAARSDLERLITQMERDEFDLIAVGRALLSDPQWTTKVREGDADGLRGFEATALAELA